MLLTLDIDRNLALRQVGSLAPMTTVESKRGREESVVIAVVAGNQQSEVPDIELLVAVKVPGKYDGPLAALCDVFTYSPTANYYEGVIDWITDALDTAFFVDGDPSNDKPAVDLMLEVCYRISPTDDWKRSINPIKLVLRNNVYRDDEADPSNPNLAPNYLTKDRVIEYLKDVTGLTGGGSSKLDGLASLALTAGKLVALVDDAPSVPVLRMYEMVAATTAEAAPEVIRPDDYAGGSNEKVWRLRAGRVMPAVACELQVACSDLTTDLITGTAKGYLRMPFAMTVTEVRASVIEAPGGSTLVVDINEGGVSILSTKISVDDGEKTSTTAATAPVISDAALADDAEITFDIDQVGVSNPGKGLVVTIIGVRG
ncbi:MAG: hypothetical protein ACAI34_25300 [Verrucomicrobium sp.]